MKPTRYIAVAVALSVAAACGPAMPPEGDAGTPVKTSAGGEGPGPAKTLVAASTPEPERVRTTPTPMPELEAPSGAQLELIMETAVSSKTSAPGDRIEARLASDLTANGKTMARAGSAVTGRVTVAVPSGRVKTRARLAFVFDSIKPEGSGPLDIETTVVDITADDTHKRDAITVGGGAGAGAVIGAIADGKKGAGIGALIGAGAGTGVVLIDKGKNVSIPVGQSVTVELTRALRIRR